MAKTIEDNIKLNLNSKSEPIKYVTTFQMYVDMANGANESCNN